MDKQAQITAATAYASLIHKVEGESYKETCRRLKAAIGGRAKKQVFHMAVKLVRQ